MFKTLKKYVVLFAIFLITNTLTVISVSASDDIVKSQYDSKDYLVFTLANQLKVLVISDPSSEVSAASLVVAAGHGNAPDNYLGLPHLLEHAVFLGSKNFPEASEFDTFIKNHQGWSNGSTTSDATRYHFQLAPQALDEGLQRLADFIISPLLEEKSIETARAAVDNEFQGRTSDWRRTFAILQQESNPAHPSTKFGIGNSTTLGGSLTSLKGALVNFHQHYYGAQNMTLVVYGKESTHELKAMADKHFSQIVKSSLSSKKSTLPLHLPAQLASQIDFNIDSDIASLDIRFDVPPHHNSLPGNTHLLIEHLLGHEAEGSLYAYLKDQGLISRLQTTPEGDRYYGIFGLYIQLTNKGVTNIDKVVEAIFAYIDLLKTQPIPKWISQDYQLARQRGFDFPAEQEPGDWISDLSFDMHLYPKKNWLNHKTLISSDGVSNYLTHLTPENMQLVISRKGVAANKLDTNKVEPIYNSPYRVSPFSKTQLSRWSKAKAEKNMHYPAKNPYFSNARNKLNQPKQQQSLEHTPKLVVKTENINLWSQYKTDISADKISTKLRFYDDLDTANILVRKVRSKELQKYLTDTSYFAFLAGFDFALSSFSSGYTIEINGYSDSYFDFLQRITEVFYLHEPTEQSFNSAKQELLYDIDYRKNSRSPYWQVERAIYQTIIEQESDDVIATKLESLSYKDYLTTITTHNKFKLSGLMIGNINDKKLMLFADDLKTKYSKQLSMGFQQNPKVKQLASGQQKQQMDINHSDATIAFLVQAENDTIDTQAKFFLTNNMLQRKYYHYIRTEQSLAYFVHMKQLPTLNTANIVMVAQSANSSVKQLTQASNKFLTKQAIRLKTMTGAEFQQRIDDAIKQLNSPVFHLDSYTQELEQTLYETMLSTINLAAESTQKNIAPFNKKQQLIAALSSLTKAEFEHFYHQQIIGEESKRLLLYSPRKKISEY